MQLTEEVHAQVCFTSLPGFVAASLGFPPHPTLSATCWRRRPATAALPPFPSRCPATFSLPPPRPTPAPRSAPGRSQRVLFHGSGELLPAWRCEGGPAPGNAGHRCSSTSVTDHLFILIATRITLLPRSYILSSQLRRLLESLSFHIPTFPITSVPGKATSAGDAAAYIASSHHA